MRMSRAITVTVLAGVMLTSCCVSMSGCGRGSREPERTWYDVSGNRIDEKWKTDAQGNKLLDDQGRPIPDPHVPYDRYHQPWVFVNGAWAPPAPPPGSSSSSSSSRSRSGSSFFWGGSGYRSFSSGSSSSPSRSSTSSPSSISRGGFGSTGSGSSSS